MRIFLLARLRKHFPDCLSRDAPIFQRTVELIEEEQHHVLLLNVGHSSPHVSNVSVVDTAEICSFNDGLQIMPTRLSPFRHACSQVFTPR